MQGREAKIVIVSLVRNTGTHETDSANIGFLKVCGYVHSVVLFYSLFLPQSVNRINVALSRAKHGLYILGNACNLRKNKTWATVIDEMESHGQIGPGIPILCSRHPEQTQLVSKPGELGRFAPGGGCLLPCGIQLPCGHICPSVVSFDARISLGRLLMTLRSVTILVTTTAAPNATCHARRRHARVTIRARRDASRIAETASFLFTASFSLVVIRKLRYLGTYD